MNALNLKFTAHSLGSDSHKQSITAPTTEIQDKFSLYSDESHN